jgi:hypothetical protein
MTVQLYRHFDKSGTLLYVGVSLTALIRLQGHKRSAWFDDIVRVEIERFPTREAALNAEMGAIKSEGPKHNIVGVRTAHPSEPMLPPTRKRRDIDRGCLECERYRQARRLSMAKWRAKIK